MHASTTHFSQRLRVSIRHLVAGSLHNYMGGSGPVCVSCKHLMRLAAGGDGVVLFLQSGEQGGSSESGATPNDGGQRSCNLQAYEQWGIVRGDVNYDRAGDQQEQSDGI